MQACLYVQYRWPLCFTPRAEIWHRDTFPYIDCLVPPWGQEAFKMGSWGLYRCMVHFWKNFMKQKFMVWGCQHSTGVVSGLLTQLTLVQVRALRKFIF